MAAGLECSGDPVCRQHGAHWEAVAQGLGQRHDVGPDAGVLVGEERSCSPHADLHLVQQHQNAVAVADFPHPLKISGSGDPDAAFTLDRLQKHAARPSGNRRLQGRQVVEGRVFESLRQRGKARLEFLLPRRGDRRQRSPVEGIPHGDQLIPAAEPFMAVFPRQLDGRLVGLRAAVAEKNLVREGVLDQHAGEADLRLDVIEVGDMQELCGLLLNRRRHLRMGMSQAAHRNAPGHVQIFPAVAVPDPHPGPPDQHQGKPPVRVHHILPGQTDQFFRRHFIAPHDRAANPFDSPVPHPTTGRFPCRCRCP